MHWVSGASQQAKKLKIIALKSLGTFNKDLSKELSIVQVTFQIIANITNLVEKLCCTFELCNLIIEFNAKDSSTGQLLGH